MNEEEKITLQNVLTEGSSVKYIQIGNNKYGINDLKNYINSTKASVMGMAWHDKLLLTEQISNHDSIMMEVASWQSETGYASVPDNLTAVTGNSKTPAFNDMYTIYNTSQTNDYFSLQ